MRKKFRLNLQFFAGESLGSSNQGGNTGTGDGNQSGNAGYTYEQLEEVASARASKAERAAIANYLRGKGMSEEDITTAINDFKRKQRESQPNVSAISRERDEALAEVTRMKNEKFLVSKGVKADDLDYVAFKVNQLVTDKKDFKMAAGEFLKENPRFTGNMQVYQVSTGVSTGSSGGTATKNEQINNMIRNAFGH